MRKKSKDFKPQVFEGVEMGEMTSEGNCVCRIDEKVYFVKGAAPGDIVTIETIRSRARFSEAKVLVIEKASVSRVDPFCVHFGTCGGCTWQHLDYQSQLKYKEKQVKDCVERLAKVPFNDFRPIIGSKKIRQYRNKLEYTFSNKKWLTNEEIASGLDFDRDALGFHIAGCYDKVLEITECHHQADPSDAIRLFVKKIAKENQLEFFDIKNQVGLLRTLLIRTTSTGELMVLIQFFKDDQESIELVMSLLKKQFPEITSLLYVINSKRNDTFFDLDIVCYHGKLFITEEMDGLKFRISSKSFFQTNSLQAHILYAETLKLADVKSTDIVYDLYTGTGTIANFVARNAKKVVGVEYVPEAIEDAKLNSTLNQISNTVFFAGDMAKILTQDFISQNGKPDVIITDPPRAGMHEDVVNMMLQVEAPTIIYVSCNPATQARDLALLNSKYDLDVIQPVDMFPHTTHVENIAKLILRKN